MSKCEPCDPRRSSLFRLMLVIRERMERQRVREMAENIERAANGQEIAARRLEEQSRYHNSTPEESDTPREREGEQ